VAAALAPEALAAHLGARGVDVCVLNAGVGISSRCSELAPEEWHRMVDVNVNALFHVTRAVLPGMVARQRGRVVVVGSIAGRSAFVGGACYAATKHFVMGFAESLMLEVRDAGVQVSVVSPGSVATASPAPGAARVGPGAAWGSSRPRTWPRHRHVLATPARGARAPRRGARRLDAPAARSDDRSRAIERPVHRWSIDASRCPGRRPARPGAGHEPAPRRGCA
jgi:NAD(P)-dependent dehydrogenase (short-subunit alcohol dehydrogenase family)